MRPREMAKFGQMCLNKRDHDGTPAELLINSVFSKLRFKKFG
jgi:hypothetical protein